MGTKKVLSMAGRLFVLLIGYNLVLMFVLMAFDIFDVQWLKITGSWVFVALFVLVIWDMVSKYGNKDSLALDMIESKKREGLTITDDDLASTYKPARGYIAASIAATPAFILVMANVIAVLVGAKKVYSLLYGVIAFGNFIYYEPFRMLPLTNPFPELSIIPKTSLSLGFRQGVALVQPWLYLLPLVIFILASGISYQLGHRSRLKAKEIAHNAKNKRH